MSEIQEHSSTDAPVASESVVLYVLDWLIIKPVKVTIKTGYSIGDFKPGDQIMYSITEENKVKYMIGNVIGFEVAAQKEGQFIRVLRTEEKQQFIQNQTKASGYFEIFKKHFKAKFKQAKPINARSNLNGDMIYFYFYCEERLDFVEFLKIFRPLIPVNFFFYQVGARDMVRLHPQASDWLTECGCGPMGCCSLGVLPTIDMENVVMQSLEGRDIEKLKGRCGKLKCSVVYERYRYVQETADYPKKGDTIQYNNFQGRCIGHNAILGEIVGKAPEGGVFRGPKAQVTIVEKAKARETIADQLGISKEEVKKIQE
ncbi:MAG: regulatory iron-sulfur-containing complex subunit RicT [Candidatus Absconditabacterales bacterium]